MPDERADLARKAVVVGAVLAGAVVFLVLLTALLGPGQRGEGTAVPTYLGSAMAKGGDSGDSKSDDDSDDDSDDESDDDSGDSKSDSSSGGSSEKSKKSDDSGKSEESKSSKKSESSTKSEPSTKPGGSIRSSAGSPAGGAKSSPGARPSTGVKPSVRARPSAAASSSGSASRSVPRGGATGSTTGTQLRCTIEVTDEPGLQRALASAGPQDVICVMGDLGRSAAPVPTSSDGPGAASAAPRATSAPRSSDPARSASPTPSDGAEPSESPSPSGANGPANQTTASAPPGVGTPDQNGCTREVTDGAGLQEALKAAKPGDKICVKVDDIGVRLEVTQSGSEGAPIQIIGTGKTATKGITIKASNVVVDGFSADGPRAPGISITGNGITVRNNTITRPTGGDGDGLRFFGNDISILHNSITDTDNNNGHADCMQTFTSDHPSSQNVRIEGNRCERIANICLMAEGPGDKASGGSGNGTSADWTLTNNYCEFGAAQGFMIEAVQNVTMTNNDFTGKADKAIGLNIGATGAKVADNKLNGITYEVGMDKSSKQGYEGPDPGTGP